MAGFRKASAEEWRITGVQKGVRQRVVVAQVLHTQIACGAVVFGIDPFSRIGFGGFEMRQHVVESPALVAQRLPVIIIRPMASAIAHGIDGAGTAQHLAARPVKPAVVELGFRFGVVIPVKRRDIDQFGQSGGHVNKRVPVAAAGFQQQDAIFGVGRKPVGQHAAGRAGADNDVIKFFTGCMANALVPARGLFYYGRIAKNE